MNYILTQQELDDLKSGGTEAKKTFKLEVEKAAQELVRSLSTQFTEQWRYSRAPLLGPQLAEVVRGCREYFTKFENKIKSL